MSTTILKLSCPDRVGLLAKITNFVANQGGNLEEVHQYTDAAENWFYARLAVETKTLKLDLEGLRRVFAPMAEDFGAQWSLRSSESKPRVVLMVSKLGHCLADLLWRWRSKELDFEIPCVISNHDTWRDLVEREGIVFHHIPVTSESKGEAFERMDAIWEQSLADLIVLARYMQVVPLKHCAKWPNQIMNIHHSFLPSFVGANPYQRAHQRGVKLIGATCHYATESLDEGPIIEQEVTRVEHFHSESDLLRLGRDCERLALARGLRYHLMDRVLVRGNRTIVFRD